MSELINIPHQFRVNQRFPTDRKMTLKGLTMGENFDKKLMSKAQKDSNYCPQSEDNHNLKIFL